MAKFFWLDVTGFSETQPHSAKKIWLPITPSQENLATNHAEPKIFGDQSRRAKHMWRPITPSQKYLATNHAEPKIFDDLSSSTNHPKAKL